MDVNQAKAFQCMFRTVYVLFGVVGKVVMRHNFAFHHSENNFLCIEII